MTTLYRCIRLLRLLLRLQNRLFGFGGSCGFTINGIGQRRQHPRGGQIATYQTDRQCYQEDMLGLHYDYT